MLFAYIIDWENRLQKEIALKKAFIFSRAQIVLTNKNITFILLTGLQENKRLDYRRQVRDSSV